MTQKFIENGYQIEEFKNNADIYLINTCTVTNMADKKSRQIIRRAKQCNEEAIVVVTGCYAEINRKELQGIEGIDLIVGNSEKNNIVEIVEYFLKEQKKNEGNLHIEDEKEFADFGTITYSEKTRAVIKVQDGCNNFCSYCIIPYARGRVRSRKVESVIEEVKEAVQKGVKEVVITGIHVASYGKDFEEDIKLIDLLEQINKVEGLRRIRLGSLEPKLITKEFVDRIKKLEKICDHFHLSLQSGCDETLKRMNRKYTSSEFENGVNLLRKAFPQVALTTDIIVGFPRETEEEFKETYKFLEKINFCKMHIFPYSPREGTIAAKMEGQIFQNVKEKRSHKLIELSNKNEKNFLEKFIGKEVEVLFEEEEDGYYKGHTTNYMVVKTKGKELENKIKTVIIHKVDNGELIGNIKIGN